MTLALEQGAQGRVRIDRRRVVLHETAGIRGRAVVAMQVSPNIRNIAICWPR